MIASRLIWDGPGWYITTKLLPGTESYETWCIDKFYGADLKDEEYRVKVGKSLGSVVDPVYFSENPEVVYVE